MSCVTAPKNEFFSLRSMHRSKSEYVTFEVTRKRGRREVSPWYEQQKTAKLFIVERLIPDGIAEAFERRASIWREETDGLSSVEDVTSHSEYLKIIGMGPKVIPFLLRDLRDRGGRWFIALESITDQDPVRNEDRGYYRKMREAWLEWGRKNRYL